MIFYITFGSEDQPYRGGWIEAHAPSESDVRKAFNFIFPVNSEGFARFCSIYNEERFKATSMYANGNLGAYRHATLTTDGKTIDFKEDNK